VMGTSITAYFTLEPPPSVPFSDNKNKGTFIRAFKHVRTSLY
jgi:hypothetical protein